VLNFTPMTNVDRILAEAKGLLTEEERLELSNRLLEDESASAVEQAWLKEVQRRRAEWKAGRMNAIPWEEAQKRIFAEP
jgi:putative addiction module component (TIGR02574 family)